LSDAIARHRKKVMTESPAVSWPEKGEVRTARWRSESAVSPPKRVVIADDRMTADGAYHLACEGTAILWRGDFQNARQLLTALARRIDEPRKGKKPTAAEKDVLPPAASSLPLSADAFHRYRLAQSQRARTLGMLLLPFDADFRVPLRRAPDVQQACIEAYGEPDVPFVASLRELLGIIGAHEWRTKGVEVPAPTRLPRALPRPTTLGSGETPTRSHPGIFGIGDGVGDVCGDFRKV
jgi:hypothetical protein